jgi:hypothetical protein
MRQFIVAAAIAFGLIAIWAVILPLTAQPAPAQFNVTTSAMSRALFLCRGANGLDRACVAMLAKALALDNKDTTTTQVNDRFCRVNRQMLVSLERHDVARDDPPAH